MTIEQLREIEYREMTEEQHQIRLFEELDKMAVKHPELLDCTHIPNGGYRPKKTGATMRQSGVKPGFPDIFLPVARKGRHGLFVELKSVKKSAKVSLVQQIVMLRLIDYGYEAVVCYGWEEAYKAIISYLEGE